MPRCHKMWKSGLPPIVRCYKSCQIQLWMSCSHLVNKMITKVREQSNSSDNGTTIWKCWINRFLERGNWNNLFLMPLTILAQEDYGKFYKLCLYRNFRFAFLLWCMENVGLIPHRNAIEIHCLTQFKVGMTAGRKDNSFLRNEQLVL